MLLDRQAFARLNLARAALCDLSGPPPSLAILAARLGVSRFHLIRQFRAVFGTTPRQAQIEARLELAKELLARGERSVSEVCLEVGFSSLGTFSSLFARRVGETPSEYRRRARETSGGAERRIPGCLSLLALLPPSASPQFRRSGGPRTPP
jgi:AraC-like DNA-binding protein